MHERYFPAKSFNSHHGKNWVVMGHLRTLFRACSPNPFKRKLKKSQKHARLLFFWNRGLGDIALELYPLIMMIRHFRHDASITIITREDLFEGFSLLDESVNILVSKQLKRKQHEPYQDILTELSLDPLDFDQIYTNPDPAYWAKKYKKNLICKLTWQDRFYKPYPLMTEKPLALLHLHSETVYGFEKNLPKQMWDLIIQDLKKKGYYTLALGFTKESGHFDVDLDLRCKTSLHEVMSLMLQSEGLFIGPDSGLLNMLYYLDVQKSMHLISYWANQKVGILRQKTQSPNEFLVHTVLKAPKANLENLKFEDFEKNIPDRTALNQLYLKHSLPFNAAALLQNELKQALLEIQSYNVQVEKPTYQVLDNPPSVFVDNFEYDARIVPIILAGGQGTRLGFDKPKALFEINHVPLIEHFLKKIKNASTALKKDLKAIVIVSSEGYEFISNHLEKINYAGLLKEQVCLLIQDDHYLLTHENKLLLKSANQILKGPNGNGGVFHLLHRHGIFQNLDPSILGFEIIPIDNPLAPLYNNYFAKSFEDGHDLSVLAFECLETEINLGKLAQTEKGLRIIEYTDHPNESLKIANTGLLAFSRVLAEKIAMTTIFELHIAWKNYMCFTGRDYELVKAKKFESFIFDHLHLAHHPKVFLSQKERIFQPLKEKAGPYGVEKLEKSLALQDF